MPLWIVLCGAAAWGQLLEPGRAAADGAASREQLLGRLREFESMGDPCLGGSDGGGAYRETLRSMGYHDLLAECLENLAWTRRATGTDRPEDWRALGEAWMLSGPQGRQPAFDAFKQALKLNPDDGETLSLQAYLFHREGLYEQAASGYERALAVDPKNVRAKLGREVLRVREGSIADASAAIDALGAEAQPYDVITRVMLRKALHDFERYGGWFEDTAANHAAYARLLYRAGRISDALVAARGAVALEPENAATWNFIAAMQLQLGNLEQGRHAYDKSLEADPNQPRIREARDRLIRQSVPKNSVELP